MIETLEQFKQLCARWDEENGFEDEADKPKVTENNGGAVYVTEHRDPDNYKCLVRLKWDAARKDVDVDADHPEARDLLFQLLEEFRPEPERVWQVYIRAHVKAATLDEAECMMLEAARPAVERLEIAGDSRQLIAGYGTSFEGDALTRLRLRGSQP